MLPKSATAGFSNRVTPLVPNRPVIRPLSAPTRAKKPTTARVRAKGCWETGGMWRSRSTPTIGPRTLPSVTKSAPGVDQPSSRSLATQEPSAMPGIQRQPPASAAKAASPEEGHSGAGNWKNSAINPARPT